MAGEFSFSVDNLKEIQDAFEKLGKQTSDFRVPFRLISSDFYRSQKKLFTLQSEGLYNPLGGFRYNQKEKNGLTRRQNAENKKERLTGHPWNPILYGRTGNLRDSTLGPRNLGSIWTLRTKELIIGSRIPYGKYHQSDSPGRIMPWRKFVFIDGGPADRSKDSNIAGRRERWLNIINDHVEQLVKGTVL